MVYTTLQTLHDPGLVWLLPMIVAAVLLVLTGTARRMGHSTGSTAGLLVTSPKRATEAATGDHRAATATVRPEQPASGYG